MRSRAGFTLLEVLAAAVLLGVIAVAVTPLWSATQRAPIELPRKIQAQESLSQLSPEALRIMQRQVSATAAPGLVGATIRVESWPGQAPVSLKGCQVVRAVVRDASGRILAEHARCLPVIDPP